MQLDCVVQKTLASSLKKSWLHRASNACKNAMLPQLSVFYCRSITCSTKNHIVKLPKLFIVIQHQVFFDIL